MILVPTVHLNGTSKQELLDQVCNAIGALRDAGIALAKACPNARDYYVQVGNPINQAQEQHFDRMKKLGSIVLELETIADAIGDQ